MTAKMVNSLLIDGLCHPTQKAEEWRPIPGYEGIYEASSMGRIRSAEGKTTHSVRSGTRHWKQRVLRQKWRARPTGKKDARVSLWKDKRESTQLVARLVCAAFYGNAPGMTVNHKDGDPSNNAVENLEWATLQDNVLHAFETGLNTCNKRVVLIDERTGKGTEFYSHAAASRFLGRNVGYVSNAIRNGYGLRSTAGRRYKAATQ